VIDAFCVVVVVVVVTRKNDRIWERAAIGETRRRFVEGTGA